MVDEASSCQEKGDRKGSVWRILIVWTLCTFVLAFVATSKLAEGQREMFFSASSISAVFAKALFVFIVPPIVTIWGVGVILVIYKSRFMCPLPTGMFLVSTLVSAFFDFPLTSIFTLGTIMVCGAWMSNVYFQLEKRVDTEIGAVADSKEASTGSTPA